MNCIDDHVSLQDSESKEQPVRVAVEASEPAESLLAEPKDESSTSGSVNQASKRKKASKIAKLKQSKLLSRREQFLAQVSGAKPGEALKSNLHRASLDLVNSGGQQDSAKLFKSSSFGQVALSHTLQKHEAVHDVPEEPPDSFHPSIDSEKSDSGLECDVGVKPTRSNPRGPAQAAVQGDVIGSPLVVNGQDSRSKYSSPGLQEDALRLQGAAAESGQKKGRGETKSKKKGKPLQPKLKSPGKVASSLAKEPQVDNVEEVQGHGHLDLLHRLDEVDKSESKSCSSVSSSNGSGISSITWVSRSSGKEGDVEEEDDEEEEEVGFGSRRRHELILDGVGEEDDWEAAADAICRAMGGLDAGSPGSSNTEDRAEGAEGAADTPSPGALEEGGGKGGAVPYSGQQQHSLRPHYGCHAGGGGNALGRSRSTGGSKAWRPDDVARPDSLPPPVTRQSPHAFSAHHHHTHHHHHVQPQGLFGLQQQQQQQQPLLFHHHHHHHHHHYHHQGHQFLHSLHQQQRQVVHVPLPHPGLQARHSAVYQQEQQHQQQQQQQQEAVQFRWGGGAAGALGGGDGRVGVKIPPTCATPVAEDRGTVIIKGGGGGPAWGGGQASLLSAVPSGPSFCPICTEELDTTDSSLVPCLCGFRLCLFCLHRIASEDGRCPGCRRHYSAEVTAKILRSPVSAALTK